MNHVVLLGDSIFDNARYVPGHPAVIEQLSSSLPTGWRATLLARDGDTTEDVEQQLLGLPADATHLVVSVGGNDALGYSGLMFEAVRSVGEALEKLADARDEFRERYESVLRAVAARQQPTTVCTIYDAIPGLNRAESAALTVFNDVIVRSAFAASIPLVDLRWTCRHADDFSPLSPIEPSWRGGQKIATAIANVVTKHDFSAGRCIVYG